MIKSIQHLRGYASLAVVVFHLYPVFILGEDNPIGFGAAGVDVFFVISGFIMWHVAQAKEPAPEDFLAHRFVRVAPPYWIITLVLAAAAALKPNLFPLDHPTVGHVAASMAFIPHGEGAEGRPLVSQGWTLNFEIYFYLFFAAMLALKSRIRLPAITIAFVALAGVGFVIRPTTPILGLVFSPLLLEFLAGIYIAIAFQRRILMPWIVALVVIVVSVLVLCLRLDLLGHRAIFWGIPSALIVWSMVSMEAAKPFKLNLWNRFLNQLGNASYAIYLVHFLAGSAFQIVGAALGFNVHGWLQYFVGIAIAMVAGFAFHFAIEEPVRKSLTSRIRHSSREIPRPPLRPAA